MTPQENPPEPDAVHCVKLRPAETPSEVVVNAVAEVTNRSPIELQPIAEVIDPDALNKYISWPSGTDNPVTATFDYAGCQVLVTPTEIRIES